MYSVRYVHKHQHFKAWFYEHNKSGKQIHLENEFVVGLVLDEFRAQLALVIFIMLKLTDDGQ